MTNTTKSGEYSLLADVTLRPLPVALGEYAAASDRNSANYNHRVVMCNRIYARMSHPDCVATIDACLAAMG
jgi:hypothetical protein